MFHVEIVPFIT